MPNNIRARVIRRRGTIVLQYYSCGSQADSYFCFAASVWEGGLVGLEMAAFGDRALPFGKEAGTDLHKAAVRVDDLNSRISQSRNRP